MTIKSKVTFEDRNKLRDSLSKEIMKNGMKVTDNMNGEKNANKKLELADVSDKMTIPQVKEFIRRYKTGENTRDYLKKFNLKKIELDELQKLADKRTS
jgi:hypothetical protein